MDIDALGINTLAADLGKAGARAVPLVAAVVAKTAADIEADAKLLCPVDTGNLRSSISAAVTSLQAEIGPTAEYGAYVEFGTSTQAPAAYMGPALDRRGGDFEQAIAKVVDGLL